MTELIHSVAIESRIKRIPKSKSGKLLAIVRDTIIEGIKQEVKTNKRYDPHKDREKIEVVDKLNKRIASRLKREDLKEATQLPIFNTGRDMEMTTDERTVVEFSQYGDVIRAEFTGDIEQAKANLKRMRGVETIRFAHWKRVDSFLIRGMWTDMVCVNKPLTYQ